LTLLLPLTALLACNGQPVMEADGPVTDTNTADDPVILPLDTSVFVPSDTGTQPDPNLQPDHFVYLLHEGSWALSGGGLSGQLSIQEYVDELDTARANPFLCDVLYALTGTEISEHTCDQCDLVIEVEHYVSAGDPSICSDPDTPPDGAVWQLGYASSDQMIYLNYFGTDVWLPWYEATTGPPNIQFSWSATIAIEAQDTGDAR